MNAFRKLILVVVAWLGIHSAAHADLSPGSGVIGAGNLHGGQSYDQEPGSFYRDKAFYIGWGNSPGCSV